MSQILGSKAILLVALITVGALVVFLLKRWADNYLCGRWVVRGVLIIAVSLIVFVRALSWHILAAAAVWVAYAVWWAYAALQRVSLTTELRTLCRLRSDELAEDFESYKYHFDDVLKKSTPTLPGFCGVTYSDLHRYNRDVQWELNNRDEPCISLVMREWRC